MTTDKTKEGMGAQGVDFSNLRGLANAWRTADTISGPATPFDVLAACADQLDAALSTIRSTP